MITKHALWVAGEFPIELWDDAPAREAACWPSLHAKAEALVAEGGRTLAGEIDRTVRFMRIVDSAQGEPMAVECARPEAEMVHLTLRMWAQ